MTQSESVSKVKSESQVQIYQLHIVLLKISPAIWRRLQVRSDSTITDLHYSLQIALGWTDSHLHQFTLHGKTYGIYQPGGTWFDDDPDQLRLSDLKLRLKERFLYEYDFGDKWRHQIRLEQILPLKPKKVYPFCSGGARIRPPEDCGGPYAFMANETELNLALWEKKRRLIELLAQILPGLEKGQTRKLIEQHRAEAQKLLNELAAAKFDRKAVNQRLKQYSENDSKWREGFM